MSLLLTYYGDDFTGSTDALEVLTRAGLKTKLFAEPPTPEQLAAAGPLQAVGVAGTSRSLTPAAMEEQLGPVLEKLAGLGAPFLHYKVCSTFDSSPTVGSIGKACEIGADVLQSRFVPIVAAAPALGRYQAFGHLFARASVGGAEEVFRLDRHPSASTHTVTPMRESDLRRHLAMQTQRSIGLFDLLALSESRETQMKRLNAETDLLFFDAIDETHLATIGELLLQSAAEGPLFCVGSSGLDMALALAWQTKRLVSSRTDWAEPGHEQLLVASGSCSPITAKQISWALAHGFAEAPLDTPAIVAGKSAAAIDEAVAATAKFVAAGKNVIVHTSRGGDDPRLAATRSVLGGESARTSEILGQALGDVLRQVLPQSTIKRLCIAGGDSSSYAARQLGIESLQMIAPLAPGAPLCKISAPGSPADGLEICFKGGQVGAKDYFAAVERGVL
jgi:uncharacterized protein YgbK (DUF1537 family)